VAVLEPADACSVAARAIDRLPDRPLPSAPNADPIGAMLAPNTPEMTGSIPPPARAR